MLIQHQPISLALQARFLCPHNKARHGVPRKIVNLKATAGVKNEVELFYRSHSVANNANNASNNTAPNRCYKFLKITI